jgi:hypothetical protein
LAVLGLPLHFIQTEAGYAFFDGIKNGEMKFLLLMGGERALGEAVSQALR